MPASTISPGAHAHAHRGPGTRPAFLDRLLAFFVRVLVILCRIDAEISPRVELAGSTAPTLPNGLRCSLAPPLVRRWTAPLPARGAHFVCHTYDQPGRWMSPGELRALHAQLRSVASRSMDEEPEHRLLQENCARDALANRIVSVAVDENTGEAVGFTAMVCLPSPHGVVVHLGLTMIAAGYRGRRIQSPLFTRCLVAPMYNWFTPAYTVTSIAASPAGIGAFADYFVDTFPTYRGERAAPAPWHLGIAHSVLGYHRHEFACARDAVFHDDTFVVSGSNNGEGGAPQFIKPDGEFVSRYKREACNEYCRRMLDVSSGDELFQVGRVDVVLTSLKYMFSGRAGDRRAKKPA